MTGHGKVGTADNHARITGVGTKGERLEDRNLGIGGVLRRSEDISLGVCGIGRSEDMYFGVGGSTNVDAKDYKSCEGHRADRSSGTYGKEHGISMSMGKWAWEMGRVRVYV